MSQNENNFNKDAQPKAKLIGGDGATDQMPITGEQPEEQKYYVNGQSVSREEYMAALPKAGYVRERMPANHYPSINTK